MDRNLLKLPGVKFLLLELAFLTVIQSVSIILAATWLAKVITALFSGEPLQEQFLKMGLFLLAFLFRYGAASFQQRLAYRFAERTGTDVRKRLMDKLFQYGPRFAKAEGTGNLVTLVLEGVTQFRTYLELFLPRMISTAITPALIVIYVFTLDIMSGVILVVTMPILIGFLILIGLAARKHTEKQLKSFRVLSNHFVDSLRGLETLKFLGQSRQHSEAIGEVSHKYRAATMRTLRVAFLSSFALELFTMLSVASVAVNLGFRLIDGDMSLLPALTVLILAPEYFLPVQMMGVDYHATLNGKEAGKSIQSIINRQEEETGSSELPAAFAWTDKSILKLSSIGVQYEKEGQLSLEHVSIEIQGTGKIGIIGESGAGKSTLIDVLAGFRNPSSGEIILDGIRQQSLTNDAWRKETTYIPQHPYLFNVSLSENIRFYKPDATDEEVKRAVSAAGLSSLVERLPNGLDELIGNGGRQLSGGQEQRVALARVFLSARPILLLDEPTAHLDIETEYELKETMLRLFENKLVFFATHRLHWMPHMDRIIVLDKGKVAETGTHQELVAHKGVYYRLLTAQREGII
ncbi:thiol reductant ABC exporter subunit CydD [Thermoactinomyces mirandus]|uniref:Thiol reductant ABC exporter subunit CydD n=1 Tax=Thermoactinomyces mirandus TaxID=2756294 RepID=A0A7W2AQS6_9BACL|nr:thiol reductant ABC exporter subunit CydD [Thermoactinomyces mirandus]MBA4600815.1 thiol reductant ABC exporter subunit CydD [Thermoactinomyces mirandus]